MGGVCRFDRDTHQITMKTEMASLANGGPHKLHLQLSCKAGGLQRRRALTTLISWSFHHIIVMTPFSNTDGPRHQYGAGAVVISMTYNLNKK